MERNDYDEAMEELKGMSEEDRDELAELLNQSIADNIRTRNQLPLNDPNRAALSKEIKDDVEALKFLQGAREAEAGKRESEINAENARTTKNAWKWQIAINALSSAGTQFAMGLLNRQNVKTVVGLENSGELCNSKAFKFVK